LPTPPPLPRLLVEPMIRAALLEDLGRAGDITSNAVIPPEAMAEGAIVARDAGVIAGTQAATLAFALVDPAITIIIERPDGAEVAPEDIVLRL
jgi:nicotinate-nucleotide pyrophosphorylase (carboxylating)